MEDKPKPKPRATVSRTVSLSEDFYTRVVEYQSRTGIGWMPMLRKALERLMAEEWKP